MKDLKIITPSGTIYPVLVLSLDEHVAMNLSFKIDSFGVGSYNFADAKPAERKKIASTFSKDFEIGKKLLEGSNITVLIERVNETSPEEQLAYLFCYLYEREPQVAMFGIQSKQIAWLAAAEKFGLGFILGVIHKYVNFYPQKEVMFYKLLPGIVEAEFFRRNGRVKRVEKSV